MLHDVSDINLLAFHTDGGKELVKKFTGSTDERAPLLVFIIAWTFTDKHDFGILRTFSRHGPGRKFIQIAAFTNGYVFIEISSPNELDCIVCLQG